VRDLIHVLRTATTFARDGSFDAVACREYLGRFVDAGIGVYLGDGASGEGHALTWEEHRQLYRVGVEVCKGKVPVYSGHPKQYTARATIEFAQLAVEAGVDAWVIGPVGVHAGGPTEAEYVAYLHRVLTEVNYPVVLALSPASRHFLPARTVAEICDKYPQILGLNALPSSLGALNDNYVLSLREAMSRDVPIYVHYIGALTLLDLGAAGTLGNEPNIIPKTFRRFLDAYRAGDRPEAVKVYSDIRRFSEFVAQWGGTPRWIKIAMKAFRLPGGEGGPRAPYIMPTEEELERFVRDAANLNIPEVMELASRSGRA
jgi:4-hydroxy-tetrahydrodipicolinate synthase